jgi:hypothetical protein
VLVSRPFDVETVAAALLSDANPLPLGAVSPGTGPKASREDHIHPATGGGPITLDLVCPATVSALDCVYLTGSNTCDKASASSLATGPGIGIVSAKINPTTARVQFDSVLGGFVGLVVGASYYVDLVPGGITDVVSFPPGSFVQQMGWAVDGTTLMLDTDRDLTVL